MNFRRSAQRPKPQASLKAVKQLHTYLNVYSSFSLDTRALGQEEVVSNSVIVIHWEYGVLATMWPSSFSSTKESG